MTSVDTQTWRQFTVTQTNNLFLYIERYISHQKEQMEYKIKKSENTLEKNTQTQEK